MANLKPDQHIFISRKLIERSPAKEDGEAIPWHLGSVVHLKSELYPGRPYIVRIPGSLGHRQIAISDDDLRRGDAYVVLDFAEIARGGS
ncbi:MAG TPA: hypothetical protein VF469_28405 [Kofleriaceae bacterium]